MKYGLSEKQLAEIVERIGTYAEVETAVLFGSRAIDTFKEASDVDIALKGEHVTASLAAKLKYEFEEESYLPFFFDFVAYPTITNEALRRHIDDKGIVIFRREWRECKLGDAVTFQRGHDLPKTQMNDGIYPVAGSNGIIGYHDAFTTEANGITIGRSGNIGTPHFYKTNYWAHNTVLYIKDFKGNAQKFIYYFLKTLDFTQFNTGSAVPSLNRNHIHELDINIPDDIAEQKAIASVLSSLDDKIDLLHRQNLTLEAMAETLFRQWFVIEAREDWAEGTLGDVSVNVRDSVKVDAIQENCKYIGLEHIGRKNIALKEYGSGSEVSSNKYSFNEKDILFGKLRPYFHKVCFAPFSGICSTDILVIRPIKQEWIAFCLFAFFQNDVVEFANIGSGGTRMPRTDWGTLRTYPITTPDIETINRFNNLVSPSIDKIKFNLEQIRTLETLRDALLPKLMSGEVRVKYVTTDTWKRRYENN